jgi:ABC-type transport system substrate-binding protein
MAMDPFAVAWEPDSALYRPYAPGEPRNRSHVNDPKMIEMAKQLRLTEALEARKQLVFDMQRYAAEQRYYIYLYSVMVTGSWQLYVKNYAPNLTFDYGSRAAALWLDRV